MRKKNRQEKKLPRLNNQILKHKMFNYYMFDSSLSIFFKCNLNCAEVGHV